MDKKQPSAEARELWTDLCELPDRTSPADYPDMALITETEFYAYLDAFAARSRWQLISEAPEGEHVLLWFPKGERGIGGVECGTFWRDPDGRITCFWTHGSANAGSDWEARDGEQPTHWQPLPSPPEPPSCP